jgi:hypothetical protein
MESIDFAVGESAASTEWKDVRGVEDFVGICVADSGDELLIKQDVFDESVEFADSGSEDVEREGGVEDVRSLLVEGGDERRGFSVEEQVEFAHAARVLIPEI